MPLQSRPGRHRTIGAFNEPGIRAHRKRFVALPLPSRRISDGPADNCWKGRYQVGKKTAVNPRESGRSSERASQDVCRKEFNQIAIALLGRR